jgi:nucleotide-binding universal stress UspA family protein
MGGLAVCLDGVEDEALIAAALPWALRFDWVEIWCAFGDLAARELQHLRDRHGRPPPPPRRHDDIDREQAEAVAERGLALARLANLEAQARILSGRDPGHALVAASGPDVALLLAAGHRGGVGPKSLGHVARFVIDHATGPVIVLRLR